MKTTYSRQQASRDAKGRRIRLALEFNLPVHVDEFSRALEAAVATEEGNHRLYVWCEDGSWYAKAIRKSDGKRVKVGSSSLLYTFALLCEELGIQRESTR
jgi:hypothetical protein